MDWNHQLVMVVTCGSTLIMIVVLEGRLPGAAVNRFHEQFQAWFGWGSAWEAWKPQVGESKRVIFKEMNGPVFLEAYISVSYSEFHSMFAMLFCFHLYFLEISWE